MTDSDTPDIHIHGGHEWGYGERCPYCALEVAEAKVEALTNQLKRNETSARLAKLKPAPGFLRWFRRG